MGFWNSVGKAADKTYQTAKAVESYLKSHPDVKARYESKGIPFEPTDLPVDQYGHLEYNTVLPGGIVIHTLQEYHDHCQNYWKNNQE